MKILFLTGPHGSGKTEAAKHLVFQNKKREMFDTGPIIRVIHQNQAPNKLISEWVCEGEAEYGSRFTDDLIFESLKKKITESKKLDLLIIIGYRTLSGLKYMESKLKKWIGGGFYLIYIDSTEELLRNRYNQREGLNLSQTEFRKILSAQGEKLLELKLASDFVVENNGTKEDYVTILSSIVESFS